MCVMDDLDFKECQNSDREHLRTIVYRSQQMFNSLSTTQYSAIKGYYFSFAIV